jgi:hypothetical protein
MSGRLTAVNPATGHPWTFKEAVFAVLPEAKAAAGDVVAARTLYYKVRPRLQKLIGTVLKYHYFATNVLPTLQRTDPDGVLDGVYFEPRGELHHPHTGEVIALGTREVKAYELPEWEFDKILYIEKSGLQAQLAPYQIGERYDMAIIYGNGYSPVACRDLLARSAARDITVFVAHDGDLDGYLIARTLGEATARMPDHSIEVIDLGLTVPQAIAEGLETEHYDRAVALPTGLVLDGDALRWFTGVPSHVDSKGRTHFQCTRVELNAFSADQLAEFIEAQLAAHGVVPKLVPPPEVLDGFVVETRDDQIDTLIWDYLRDRIDFGEVVTQVKERHPEVVGEIDEERVRGWFDATARNNTKPWRTAVERLVDEDIEAVTPVTETVRELVIEQLGRAMGADS